MHRLTTSFVLGYHGCDRSTGERLLAGEGFKPSNNDYDWLGPGIYFWEANPQRGLDFAVEVARRSPSAISNPFVVGAIIELGLCLDLTTTAGIEQIKIAYESLAKMAATARIGLPRNHPDLLRRKLDCAVIRHYHAINESARSPAVDTVKGIFVEGRPLYEGAGFHEKTHTQISVCNPGCIKGVFRVAIRP